MNRLMWSLAWALFIVACHDDETSKVSKYTLPPPSNGFKEIYRRSEGVDINGESGIYSYKDGTYYLSPPENRDQKQYCKDSFESTPSGGTYCSFIEAPEDGEIEVFGVQLVDSADGEIGLFINDELYRRFVRENKTFIRKDTSGTVLVYSIQMNNVPVKKRDKIFFKKTATPISAITQLAINFKPKEDKKTGEDTVGPVPTPSGNSGSQ